MATLYKVPIQNSIQYTLDSQIAAGATSLTLNQSVTGIVQAPGVLVIDRVDSSGNKTPSKRDYKTFTGVSGAQLTGLSGGLAGSSDQVHEVGAVVEFMPDIIWAQALYDVITTEHNTSGNHTAITASSASIAVLDVKTSINASAASVNGLLRSFSVSGVSGASMMMKDVTFTPGSGVTMYMNGVNNVVIGSTGGAAGTGGFNALFQVPGNLASLSDIGGLIPVPTAFTAQYMNAYVKTPASLASVSATILKNNAVIGVIGILAGATFASSASLSATSLAAGDELRMNINSTASLAADLSVVLRAS